MSEEILGDQAEDQSDKPKPLGKCRTPDDFAYYTNILRDEFSGLGVVLGGKRTPRSPNLDQLDKWRR